LRKEAEMPKDLFAPARPGKTKHGWTLIGSLALHAALLIMFVGVSLSAALNGPPLLQRVDRFIVATTPPALPPPPAPRPMPQKLAELPNPMLAPIVAPVGLQPEVDVPTGNVGIPEPLGVSNVGIPAALGTAKTMLAAPPPIPEVRRVGGEIRAPQRLVYVPPVYPPVALSAKAEGEVILEATLDETGAVRDLKVIKSHPLFDRAAIDAVQKWRYSPTRLNGVPVSVIMSITVRFALR
jgi:periplasmic protein TonB